MEFEWDKPKAEINAHKHGVTFDEAATVFLDEFAVLSPTRTTPWISLVTSRLARYALGSYLRFRTLTDEAPFVSSARSESRA